MPLRPNHRDRPRCGQGFTLIELIITIMILGFVSLILIPFVNTVVQSPNPIIRQKAISLGQAMMDEVLSKRWDENTPVGAGPVCTAESPSRAVRPSLLDDCVTTASVIGTDGETQRSAYDDVDDYHNYSEPDVNGKFHDQQGNEITGFEGFSRTVTVRYIASTDPAIDQNTPAAPGTTDTKLVIVEVSSPIQETLYFVTAVCNL